MSQIDLSGELVWKISQFSKKNDIDMVDALPKVVAGEFKDLGIREDDIEIVRFVGQTGWPVVRIHGPNAQEAARRYYEDLKG